MTRLSGWGRTPVVEASERLSEEMLEVCRGAMLTRGLGRSYGDASLPHREGSTVACSRLADRVLAFDTSTGVLRAEAGFRLSTLDALARPIGWTSPVCPGTSWVTLGGMVASDIHGKNHHVAGTFGGHVRSLSLLVADGRILEIGPASEPELFAATLGGMGLTGHILEVEVQLTKTASPWIHIEEQPVPNLDVLLTKLREASNSWPYTVAWVDALARGPSMGRGVVMSGRWAEPHEAPAHQPPAQREFRLPVDLPGWALGRFSVKAFDELFYHSHRLRPRRGIVHPVAFFYPLDACLDWNRMYGRRGFIQYQCVLPVPDDSSVVRRFFETLTAIGGASFLTVIKDCGPEGRGLLSFPRPGVSVALDLPMRGAATQALVDALNEVVIDAGGRIYLAKDSLTRPEHFRAMEPRIETFNKVRRAWDPEASLRSALSVRLLGDEA
ncbi:MAG: decaprenylphospho-beta-D-ribofuranose 2-oxidase [Pseudohongiellaceae bacterium]|jgi:decaprenylphospho-beta-D-ribofuranose 2-oxidase